MYRRRGFSAKKERRGKDQQVGSAMRVKYEGPQMGQCFVKLRSADNIVTAYNNEPQIKPATACKIVLEPADCFATSARFCAIQSCCL